MPITIHYPQTLDLSRSWEKTFVTSFALFDNKKGMDRIRKAFDKFDEDFQFHMATPSSGIDPTEIPALENSITVVFTNNVSNDDRPLTAWMLAHRISHTFQHHDNLNKPKYAENMLRIMNNIADIYNDSADHYKFNENSPISLVNLCKSSKAVQKFRKFVDCLLTMRSARVGIIGGRFETDGFGELMAQYIIGGKIRFNRLDVYDHEVTEMAEQKINKQMGEFIRDLRGKVLVL